MGALSVPSASSRPGASLHLLAHPPKRTCDVRTRLSRQLLRNLRPRPFLHTLPSGVASTSGTSPRPRAPCS
eukprot:11294020-Alexandrium_andersonii.AAC.1